MKTKREDIYRGIPLSTWEEVEAAIMAFDEGRVPGARAAQQESLSGMDGMGAALLLMNEKLSERSGASSFVQKRVLKPLKESLQGKKEGSAEVDFDWDGPGVWHKTSLRVRKAQGKFFVEIWAAYVGTKPEENLAKMLGIEMSLVRSVVSAVFPAKTQKFRMDLAPVFAALGGDVFPGGLRYTVQDVVRGYAGTEKHSYPTFDLYANAEIQVAVYPDGCYRHNIMWPVGTTEIECEAHLEYGAEPKNGKQPFAPGLLTFNIGLPTKGKDDRAVALTTEDKKKILDQASRIEKALQAI